MIKFAELDLSLSGHSLGDKLLALHNQIISEYPSVSRIACALYERETDLLKTFINSTRHGHAIAAYDARLHETPSLLSLYQHRQCRVISNIANEISPGTKHSDWLLQQGYLSSFTIPMFKQDKFVGFIFIDSDQEDAFSDSVQRDLLMLCTPITEAIINQVSAVRLLIATATAIGNIASVRDFETGLHLTRMAQLSRLIAQNLPTSFGLDDEIIEHIYLFSPLHDIGKIGIPDAILLKPGRLTPEERGIMESHVDKGVEIVDQILQNFNLMELKDAQIMHNIIACHHEFMDGSGYPRGLAGEAIPIEARIVTVADIFDALTHHRPYKQPWSVEDAIAELSSLAQKGKLDKHCVQALISVLPTARQIVIDFVDKIPA